MKRMVSKAAGNRTPNCADLTEGKGLCPTATEDLMSEEVPRPPDEANLAARSEAMTSGGAIPLARSKFRHSLTQAKFDPEEVGVRLYADEGLHMKGLMLLE